MVLDKKYYYRNKDNYCSDRRVFKQDPDMRPVKGHSYSNITVVESLDMEVMLVVKNGVDDINLTYHKDEDPKVRR